MTPCARELIKTVNSATIGIVGGRAVMPRHPLPHEPSADDVASNKQFLKYEEPPKGCG